MLLPPSISSRQMFSLTRAESTTLFFPRTGENGDDVMMATLRVEHDETDVGLYYKGGDKIEANADGTLTVKLKDGQVRLTARSYSDPDLNGRRHGEEDLDNR